ncbi:Inosine/xanthosine triphosphatase [hydrothermal vent metagenome]|uniref:inosine/xanthosine triphosphatase n=1 Tax=hydrothermal vent metagenome TaxID=652676 RepID=A0A3B0UMT2_9ZZZZ
MKIAIGTKNKVKVMAVKEILRDYPHLAESESDMHTVDSGVGDQPLSIEETVRGAINRAKNAFNECTDCDYSFGIESGLIEVPYTKSGYMDVCIVAIYDGSNTHLGMSSGWEFKDPEMVKLMTEEGLNMTEASNKAGLSTDENLGEAQGAIGIVTKGRVDRKEYTKQALRMALIHIDVDE